LPLSVEDCIVDVLYVCEGIKTDSLYAKVLKALRNKKVLEVNSTELRYQIIEADSTKTWTTGGSFGGNYVGPAGNLGTAGGAPNSTSTFWATST